MCFFKCWIIIPCVYIPHFHSSAKGHLGCSQFLLLWIMLPRTGIVEGIVVFFELRVLRSFWWDPIYVFFSFVAYTLGVVSKKLLPIPRSQGSLLVFSSTSWMALVLTFRCLTFWVKPYSCFVDWWLSACPPVVRSASVTLRGWRLKACGREPFTPLLPPPPPPPPWTPSRPLLAPEEWELWSKDSGS